MKLTRILLLAVCLPAVSTFAAPRKALIVDGQNNHNWQLTTPVLKKIVEDTGLPILKLSRST